MEQITASAGSGKTYTLTRRFLERLANALPDGGPSLCLLEGDKGFQDGPAPYSLAGILAATFTNKAAAEMQARVVKELKLQALSEGDGDPDFPLTPAQARHWIDNILRRFDAMNIRTIDSLLIMLVRLNALSLDLPPDFAPLFSLDEALAPLYDTLLDNASENPGGTAENLFREACRSLLRHQRAKGVAAGDMLRSRLRELVNLHLNGARLPEPEHGAQAAARFAELRLAMVDAATALDRLGETEGLAISANARKFLCKCRDCPPMSMPDLKSVYASKLHLDEWLNKASRGKASADALGAFADLAKACASLRQDGPSLLATVEFMPLVQLARPLIEGLEAMQGTEGFVPAARLPSLALESISGDNGVSDAFCRLGDTLAHLLFDEFQDTSTDQWQAITPLVVECLSRGGSLTYVGDVKQAIYGWRKGNAELFDQVAGDAELTVMLDEGPKHTTLPYNWRSAPAVVETNNRIFGPLADHAFARRVLEAMLPAAVEPEMFAHTTRSLAAAFSQCEQRVPQKNTDKPGYVRLVHIERSHTADLLEAVKEELEPLLREELLTRRSPGEIAVLVRKNDEASLVAEWLSEWHIPVVTEHSFRLGAHPLIARIADALAFLEYPMDDAAFWSAVSGPELFAHPSAPNREKLAGWLSATREHPGSGPLFLAFRRDFPDAWQSFLAPFLDQAGLLSAYDTVRELIRHCRLFERFPEHAPFLQRFAEVAHAAENKGQSSLSAFLDFWNDAGQAERVPMPENMNAVRILSMHKSKGLEFPVVIVPFHHQAELTIKPLAVEEKNGLPLITHRDNASAESVRGAVEQINLLYVAWTRPSEELHAFITKSKHSASHSPLAKALEALLETTPFTEGVYAYGVAPPPPIPACAFQDAAQPLESFANAGSVSAEIFSEHAPQTERSAVKPLMAWLPRLKIFRNHAEGKAFSERQRGLLAHACLEALRLTEDRQEDIARAVTQGLRAFPVPMPDPEAIRRDMESMLSWYASLPEAALWVRYGSPEQPLMDADGNLRRVDLLVDAPNAPMLAVEYKTGRPTPEHATQVRRYTALLRQSLARTDAARKVAGVVVYLDLKECVHIAEEPHA